MREHNQYGLYLLFGRRKLSMFYTLGILVSKNLEAQGVRPYSAEDLGNLAQMYNGGGEVVIHEFCRHIDVRGVPRIRYESR